MNITIVDLYCASNRGDAAILIGMIEALRNKIPDADILVLSSFPETVAQIANHERSLKVPVYVSNGYSWKSLNLLRSIKVIPPNGTLKMLRFITWGFFKKRNLNLNKILQAEDIKIAEALYGSELIIGSGGGYLNDNYRPAIVGRLFNLWLGRFLQKPVMIYAQSIGPFNSFFYKKAAQMVLNKVNLITLRDNRSKFILDKMGVNKPAIYVTADAAFGLPIKDHDIGRSLLEKEGFDSGSADLKISISVRKWNYYSKDNYRSHQEYIKCMAQIADHLIETQNANIIFASTCTNFAGHPDDDRIVAQEVIDNMKNEAKILKGEYSPQQLSAIYGCMDLHIGTRMHSNILSMLSGTPVIAIQYEFKTSEMMHSLNLEDLVLDINNIDMEHFKFIVENLLHNKEEVSKKMSSILIELKDQAIKNADLASTLLNSRYE